jgi:hypothetical protein
MNCAVPSGTRYLHTILKIAIHLLEIREIAEIAFLNLVTFVSDNYLAAELILLFYR